MSLADGSAWEKEFGWQYDKPKQNVFKLFFKNGMAIEIVGKNILDALLKYQGDSDMDNVEIVEWIGVR